MPRRKLFDLSTLTFDQMKQLSMASNRVRTGHFPLLGGTLYNYKTGKPVHVPTTQYIPPVSVRRTSPVFETIPKNKIFTNSKAMPYRRVYRRKTRRGKKRSFKRKPRIPLGIPASKVVRFRQVYTGGGLAAADGTLVMYPIKANSLNDALGTLGSTLPHYLDQWAALYTKYIILGSKVTIRFSRVTGTGAQTVGIHLADNNTSLADHDYYREAKRTKTAILDSSRPTKTLTFNYSGKKFWKVQSLKDDSEQEASFTTAPGDPTDIAYYHMFIQDFNKGATATDVEAQVTLEFICLLTNPITPSRSSL